MPPYTDKPTLNTDNAFFIPLKYLMYRGLEEHVGSGDISTILGYATDRVHAVVLALAHFLPANIWRRSR